MGFLGDKLLMKIKSKETLQADNNKLRTYLEEMEIYLKLKLKDINSLLNDVERDSILLINKKEEAVNKGRA